MGILFQFIKYKAMKREEAKELLPIIQAFADGKHIQWRNHCKNWIDIDERDGLNTEFPLSVYRIKPEPKYRPFKSQEECWNEMLKHHPFGYIKGKGTNNIFLITEININSNNELYFCLSNSTNVYGSVCLFDSYTFVDGKPFGIKEE